MRDVDPEKNKTVGAALQQWRLKRQVFSFRKGLCCIVWQKPPGPKKKKTAQFVPYGVLYHLLLLLLFFLFKDKEHKREKWWCSEWERTDSSDSLDMNQYWAVVAHYYSRSVAIYSSHTEVTANDDLHFQTAHWEVSTRCYRRGLLANLQLPPLVSCNSESLKSGACRLHWSDCLCVVVVIPFMPLPVTCAFIKHHQPDVKEKV